MYGVTRLDVCEEIALITFRKIPGKIPLMSDIFARFADHGIVIDMISQTSLVGENVSLSFTCMDSDMVKVLEITRELSQKYPPLKPMVSSGNCKIQLTGEEMRTAAGVFARVLSALSGTSAEIQQVSTSEVDISLLVTSAHMAEAVKALKSNFQLA